MKHGLRPRLTWLCLALMLLTACGNEASASGAARATFVVFLCFMAGIFFIGDYSVNILRKWHIDTFLKKHIRTLYTAFFVLGAPVALLSLGVTLVTGYGQAEAYGIGWLIIGLAFVLCALCIKRWDETDDDTWLRKIIQVLYIGTICFISIYYFIKT